MQIGAQGDVGDAGTASLLDAGSLAVDAAGNTIDFRASTIDVGTGVAGTGDTTMLGELQQQAPNLVPVSAGPNGQFAGGLVQLGTLNLAGDYLQIQADDVRFNGAINAPLSLLVHFLPLTQNISIGLEQLPSNLEGFNLNAQNHLLVFPGTTFVIGGSGYSGDIFIGENGALDFGTHADNLVFLTSGQIHESGALNTTGAVVFLNRFSGGNVFVPPLLPEFFPDAFDNGSGNLDPSSGDQKKKDQDDKGTGAEVQGPAKGTIEQNTLVCT
jgi:hypothetical protein